MRRGLVAGLALVLLTATPATGVELDGTWHLLVHYTDAETSKPDQPRWEDRLWVFEAQGRKLVWHEYPLVIFSDAAGRFERLGTNRASRVLHHWEPNDAQRAQISRGLEYNTRGKKQKTLRGSAAKGWSSNRGAGYQSARYLTYVENWSIEDPAGLPVFLREDTLAGAGAEEFAGKTRLATTAVEQDGRVLVGTYERDGTRSGTFRLTRSGAASVVKGSGKTQGERVVDAFFGQAAGQLLYSAGSDEASEKELRRRAAAGEVGEEERQQVRLRFEETLEKLYRDQGNDPRAHRPQIQSLARKMTALYLDDGKSLEEISGLMRSGQLRP